MPEFDLCAVYHACIPCFFFLSVESEHHPGATAKPPWVPGVGACGELLTKPCFLCHTQSWRSLQFADQLPGTAELFPFVHFLLPVHCVFIHVFPPLLSDVRLPVDCVVKSGRKASDGQNTKLYNIFFELFIAVFFDK